MKYSTGLEQKYGPQWWLSTFIDGTLVHNQNTSVSPPQTGHAAKIQLFFWHYAGRSDEPVADDG